MAYVPAVPGFTPVSYGQGYGDWQQYAGYNKDNPFGASPAFLPKDEKKPKAPVVPPTAPIIPEMKPVDYSLPMTGPMGASPVKALGNFSPSQMGEVPDFTSLVKKDEDDF